MFKNNKIAINEYIDNHLAHTKKTSLYQDCYKLVKIVCNKYPCKLDVTIISLLTFFQPCNNLVTCNLVMRYCDNLGNQLCETNKCLY